jgi:hypothetical protein
MIGAMRWLDAHRDELADRPWVWALNFDGAGNPGQLVLLARYGFGRRAVRPQAHPRRDRRARRPHQDASTAARGRRR